MQAGDTRRCGFDPWVGKMPWRRKWQPILEFFPGKSHGQKSLAGYSPWGCKRVRHYWTHTHTYCMSKFYFYIKGLYIASTWVFNIFSSFSWIAFLLITLNYWLFIDLWFSISWLPLSECIYQGELSVQHLYWCVFTHFRSSLYHSWNS